MRACHTQLSMICRLTQQLQQLFTGGILGPNLENEVGNLNISLGKSIRQGAVHPRKSTGKDDMKFKLYVAACNCNIQCYVACLYRSR